MASSDAKSPFVLAVASDLHAYDDGGKTSPSHLRISDPEDQPGQHPISGLLELITKEQLRADLLLCPGDLADKAHPASLQYAWRAIHALGTGLRATATFATSGNHDLDSRYVYNDYDAKGVLQALTPPYPLSRDDQNDRYWARNFVVVEEEAYRAVILNSSAYHGSKQEEFQHGRVSSATLAALELALESTGRRPVNVLLCHHHPQQHMELQLGDYDVMKNGQLLLDLLGSSQFGRWLVVHGHKHHPKLAYAAGGSSSPVVLSAGSLCASLYRELQSRARNQFHLVHLPFDRYSDLGFVGRVQSWDWAAGMGWERAGDRSGLPAWAGFGFRGDVQILAKQLAETLGGAKESWNSIAQRLPQIDYLLPQDFADLERDLRIGHGLRISSQDGQPVEVGSQT